MSAQYKQFGPRRYGQSQDLIARELAGEPDKARDPKWLTPKEAAPILGIAAVHIYRGSIYRALQDVVEFKREGQLLFYALNDVERIGALRKHNNVGVLEACRMFCEENE